MYTGRHSAGVTVIVQAFVYPPDDLEKVTSGLVGFVGPRDMNGFFSLCLLKC